MGVSQTVKKFCMVCENRSDDPTIEIKFELQCPKCDYWICESCKDQMTEVGKYSCLNCRAKLIPNIVEFEPILDDPEKTIEDYARALREGGEASGYTMNEVTDAIEFAKAPRVAMVSQEVYKDVPIRASIEAGSMYKDVPIRATTEVLPGDVLIPSTTEPGLVTKFVNKVKRKKMTPIEKLKAGKLKDVVPYQQYKGMTNAKLLTKLEENGCTTSEVSKILKSPLASTHSRLVRLEHDGAVFRRMSDGKQYWFSSKLLGGKE